MAPRAGYAQPGLATVGDRTARVPVHALDDFFRTVRACKSGVTDAKLQLENDNLYQWRNLTNRTSLRPNSSVPSDQLSVVDGTRRITNWTNVSAVEAQDGLYTSVTASAGSFLTGGASLLASANPTVFLLNTAAVHADDVACVTMWAFDPANTSAIFGSIIRGVSTAEYLRAEVRMTDGNLALVSRTSNTDTDRDTAAISGLTDTVPSGPKYISVGVSVTAADDLKGFVNGKLLTEFASAPFTGHQIGVRHAGSTVTTAQLVAMVAFPI